MTPRFLRWFEWLMTWEGEVYENDPDDAGGATKFGIDQRSHPNENIRSLTRDRAKQIYWDEYWSPVKAEQLSPGVGEVVANIGVNSGKGRATRWLQAAVGVVQDGNIGPKTLAAAAAFDPKTLAKKLLDRHESFYKEIAVGRNAKFLKGWLNRNNSLRKFVGV